MICITGASGTVSSEVIRQLESAKAPFRAAYFSNKKAEAARARGIDAFKTPLLLFWRRAYR